MDITYLRSSMLGTWKMCQHSFFLSYICGIPQPENQKTTKGSSFHKTMEVLACMKKAIQTNVGATTITDDSLGEVRFDEKLLFDTDFVNSIVRRSFEYYKRIQPQWTEKDYKELQKWTTNFLAFNNGLYDPRRACILEPEYFFELPLWFNTKAGEPVKLRGTIDLIVELRPDLLELVDFKTGKRIQWSDFSEKDYKYLVNDTQLCLYYYVAKNIFPAKKVISTIIYINDGGPFSLPLDDKSIEKAKKEIFATYNEITNCTRPQLKEGGESRFCKYVCGYYKTKVGSCNMCQHAKKFIQLNGIEKATAELTNKDHNKDSYKQPGQA